MSLCKLTDSPGHSLLAHTNQGRRCKLRPKTFSLALKNNREYILKHKLAISTKLRLKSPIYGLFITGFTMISVNSLFGDREKCIEIIAIKYPTLYSLLNFVKDDFQI